jgi:drug/metabolite transporter (DMT)-like permease
VSSPGASAAVPPAPAAPHATARGGRDGHADAALALWMLGLTAIWGLNAVSVKVLTGGVSPVMGATLRNAAAIVLLTGFGLLRGQSFRIRGPVRWHVLFNGVLFAGEFICSYSGARLSSAGHFALFINTSPFVVALGAHFLFPLDRLHPLKALGLLGAFAGIVLLFSDGLLSQRPGVWRGDLLILASALFWGSSTLQVKRFILGRVGPFQLLLAKLLVATPLMLAWSRWREPEPFFAFDATSAWMLAYQAGVVVFFSYLMFIVLLDRYQPSAVQSFTFLTPVWGVLAGALLLGEPLSLYLAGGMLLVGLGLYLIHRPRRKAPPAATAGAGAAGAGGSAP